MNHHSLRRALANSASSAVEEAWVLGFAILGRLRRRSVQSWRPAGRGTVVAVSPHPDDEVLGCGGTLLRHGQEGDRVVVIQVTDGRASRAGGLSSDEMAQRRATEAVAAARRLDVELEMLELPECNWAVETLVERLRAALAALTPVVVYAPSPVDYHPEHRKVARALAAALTGAASPLVRVYEVQVPLTERLVNLVVNVGAVEAQRRDALAAYESQREALRVNDRSRRYNSARWRHGTEVECFWQLAPAEYCAVVAASPEGSELYRGLHPRPFGDPLAYLRGRAERRRLARVTGNGSRSASRSLRESGPRQPQRVSPSRGIPRSLLPWLLALPTILLSLWVILAWRFNGLYGQDPYTYYGYGVGTLRSFLLSGKPLTSIAWPLGYPFLETVASFAVGTSPAAGQVVSLLAGAAAVPLTYLLAQELLVQCGARPDFVRRTAIFSAALLGVSGWLVQSSVTIMADATGMTATILSAWALTRWSREDGRASSAGWLALSGAALAWAAVTRWGQALLWPVWLLALLPVIRSRPSRFLRAAPAAVLAAGVVLAVQGWLMLSVDPHPTLTSLPFAGNLGLVHGGQGAGWSVTNLLRRDFLNPDGSQHYSLPNLLFYASAPFRPQDLSPLFAPAAVVGLALVITRYRRTVPLLILWPAVLLLSDAGLAEQNLRFVLQALPPFAILAGLGIAATWDWVGHRWRPLLGTVLLVALLAVAGVGLRDVHRLVDASNADNAVAGWAAARIPPRATTFSFGITLTLEHSTRLHPLDLYPLSRRRLAALVAHSQPVYLLVQVDQMQGQWALRSPGRDYRYLRDGPGLATIGTIHGYTLFRVRAA